jgi:Flp pilus assembly protein TadG
VTNPADLERREEGQALVEFSLAILVFLVLLMGLFDLGRGIYQYNGVSEAASEIARVTSVHPGVTLGTSAETMAVVGTQQNLVPNLGLPSFGCVDIDGSTISGTCRSGNWVKVMVAAPFTPVAPILGLLGSWNMQSTSSFEIP